MTALKASKYWITGVFLEYGGCTQGSVSAVSSACGLFYRSDEWATGESDVRETTQTFKEIRGHTYTRS